MNEEKYMKSFNGEKIFCLEYDKETLKDMVLDLQQKLEQLENTLNIEKYDYNYLKTLFSKSSKEDVLRAYTYKCEQLEKVTEARNEFEMKSMQLENIRKEAKEYINHAQNYGTMAQVMPHLKPYINGDDLLNILNKGSEDNV